MANPQIDTDLIQELINQHARAAPDMAEANVAEAFVARLFGALGWDIHNPLVWDRQRYVRTAGYADAALQIQHRPVLFVEAKRFGGVVRPQEEVAPEQTLFGDEPILSQAEREALNIDRTPEEKQAIRYARATGIRWAILTNFERLVLFNADEERVVLAFDAPAAYLERLDDLKLLTPADTPAQFDGRLEWYADLQKKPDIDEDFYTFLTDWRQRLAQAIYNHNQEEDSPLRGDDGRIDLDRLRQAVQRTLDRLIIMRYADDVGFLDQHDLLESQLTAFRQRDVYAVEYEFQDDVNRLYRAFYRRHDTTIFVPNHICERVRIPNETLVDLVRLISGISFRKFSSDILGNTYESYLGQRLELEEETVRVESDRALRKKGGIYYTPSYIVQYIVDQTLGRWLYATTDGTHGGDPLPEAAPKTLADLEGLRVLDPAMGSGSFLIYAFEVLADFYERENERIDHINAARWEAWSQKAMEEGMFGKGNDTPELEPKAPDYISRILQEHLYGVDLDPEAVEIAGVNLILRAFDRLKDHRERRKLPLILDQNLKVGNSLISGRLPSQEEGTPFADERRQLIALRKELAAQEGDVARKEQLEQIAAVAGPVNATLNAPLSEYFDDVDAKRPFNWEIAFPEAFDPDRPPAEQGFDMIVGNPPYGSRERLSEEEKKYIDEYYPDTTEGPYDTYKSFTELGIRLLREEGYFSFIIPSSYMTGKHAFKMRRLLLERTLTHCIVELQFQVFADTADTHMIFVVQSPIDIDQSADQHMKVLSITNPDELTSKDHTALIRQADWLNRERNPELLFQTRIDSQIIGELVTKIEQRGTSLDKLVKIREGINQGYIGDVLIAQHKRDKRDKKMLRGGRNIKRYKMRWGGEWVCYDHELIEEYGDRARSLPPQEFFENPKILVQYSARGIIATYDEESFYSLNLLLSLISDQSNYDLRYILAVLNSKLTAWHFQHALADRRDVFPKVTVTRLKQVPIRTLDLSDPADVAAHDALVERAQRMLDLNHVLQAASDAFDQALRAYERTPIPLRGFVTDQRAFITRHALLDANEEGEVSAIRVLEHPQGLVVTAQIDGTWRDVVRLEIEEENLQLYLLLSLRAFLYENRRKYVWSRGKVLGGVLEALEVPRLAAATPAAHQRRVTELLDDVRHFLPNDLPHHDVGLDQQGAPLHVGTLEANLEATDAEIDRRVYKLYDLTEEEISIVEKNT